MLEKLRKNCGAEEETKAREVKEERHVAIAGSRCHRRVNASDRDASNSTRKYQSQSQKAHQCHDSLYGKLILQPNEAQGNHHHRKASDCSESRVVSEGRVQINVVAEDEE